ncbi:CHAT domain-containing protein [Glycomyces sp. NPDC047369]
MRHDPLGQDRPGEDDLGYLLGPDPLSMRPPDYTSLGPGSFGDALLEREREEDLFKVYYDVLDEHEQLTAFLESAVPPHLEFLIWAAASLSFQYLEKDRNLNAARLWAERELQLAHALPDHHGPRDSTMGLGRSAHIANALMSLAEAHQSDGAIARSHDLLLTAERHLDFEDQARTRQGVTERPAIERLLQVPGLRHSLHRKLAQSAYLAGDTELASRHSALAANLIGSMPITSEAVQNEILHGRYEADMGRPDQAMARFQRAVDLANNAASHPFQATMASNAYKALGDAYGRLGLTRTAIDLIGRAKTLVSGGRNADRLADIEVSLARAVRHRPDLADAVGHYLQALQYCSDATGSGGDTSWPSPDGRTLAIASMKNAWFILQELTELLESLGRLASAARYMRLGIAVGERIRHGAIDEPSRMVVQKEHAAAYLALARVELHLADGRGAEAAATAPVSGRAEDVKERSAHLDAAWSAIEALRARSFLDALGEADLRPPGEIPDDLGRAERTLLERRRRLRSDPARSLRHWAEYEAVEKALDQLWSRMIVADPAADAYVAARRARTATPATVARAIAPRHPAAVDRADVVLVNMAFTDTDRLTYAAVSSTTGATVTTTASIDRRRLTRFIGANFGSASRVRELATGLHDLFQREMREVVAPILDLSSPSDVLVLCPAGPLNHVPLGAVAVDGEVLLARNPIATSPSASLLQSRRLRHRRESEGPHSVLGDPTGDLPGARDEALELAERWKTAPLLGAAATRDAVLDAMRTSQNVHIAAHAAYNADSPLDSGILLSDGELTAREILQTQGRSLELVTLSACETGVSHSEASEDPMGLARALLFAGAGSILVSLWKVPDDSTRRLMRHFYDALQRGVPKAIALQQAALAMRSDDDRIDRWAGFSLIGDWE